MPTVQRAHAQYKEARTIHRPSPHAIDLYDSEGFSREGTQSFTSSGSQARNSAGGSYGAGLDRGQPSLTFQEVLALKLKSSRLGSAK